MAENAEKDSPAVDFEQTLYKASEGAPWLDVVESMDRFEFQIIKTSPVLNQQSEPRLRSRYVVRWRPQCFLMEVYHQESAKHLQAEPDEVIGRLKGRIWRWKGGVLESCQMEFNDLPEFFPVQLKLGDPTPEFVLKSQPMRPIPNKPLEDLVEAGMLIRRVSRLGFGMLNSESIKWNGDEFQALHKDNRSVQGHIYWEDVLIGKTKENVDRVRYYFSKGNRLDASRNATFQGFNILYHFSPIENHARDWPKFLPDKYTIYADPDRVEDLPNMVKEVRFETWRPALAEIQMSEFDPVIMKGATEKYWYVTEDSAAFRNKAGQLQSITTFYPEYPSENTLHAKRNLLILGLALGVAGVALVYIKYGRKTSRRQSSQLVWLATVALMLLGIPLKSEAQINDQQLQTVKWFADVLENPPRVVKNFAFEWISMEPAFPGVKANVVTNHFVVRWQPNAVLAQYIRDDDWQDRMITGPISPETVAANLNTNDTLSGWFNGVFWDYSNGFLAINTNDIKLIDVNAGSDLFHVAENRFEYDSKSYLPIWDSLSDVAYGMDTLRLGVFPVNPRNLTWDYSLFRGKARNGEKIFGSVLVDDENKLNQVIFRFTEGSYKNTNYGVDYEFTDNPNLPERFPSNCRLYIDSKSGVSASELTRRIYKITYLEIGEENLGDEYYDFRLLTNLVRQTAIYGEDDQILNVYDDGKVIVSEAAKYVPPKKNYTILLLAGVGGFSIMVWFRWKQKN